MGTEAESASAVGLSTDGRILQRDQLNLGCGTKLMSNAVNVDINPALGADLIHDLNKRPWPLPGDHFMKVFVFDVLEHCFDVIQVMEEIHRVSCDGAVVSLTTPHFSSANAYIDPTHRHRLSYRSFDYITGDNEVSFYSSARYKYRTRQLVFAPSLLNRVIGRAANRWPQRYEERWAWRFPAWFIYVELEVVKPRKGATGD